MRFFSLFSLLLALSLLGCDSTLDNDVDPLETVMVLDLPADPTTASSTGGQPSSSGRYTLFSIRDNEIVLSYDGPDRGDSLSTAWDIGFQNTNIIANTTPGSQGGIQLVTGTLEEVTLAPESGYAAALPTSAGNRWYNYDMTTHTVQPIPGRTIVVRTADGRHAKLRILSYYKGNPADPTQGGATARYFTFEYVFQPDGSRDLDN